MNKVLIIIFTHLFFSIHSLSQAVIYVNAGSRAPWGEVQSLVIENNGNCRYIAMDVKDKLIDTSNFIMTQQEIQSLFQKADQVGFYSLDKEYNSGAADGWGIYLSLNHSGRKHQVHVLNTMQPAIKDFVSFLNSLLLSRDIRIHNPD